MTTATQAPWPTADMLERMGLIRCTGDDTCTTYVDPANVPSRKCQHHQRKARQQRQAETRYAPRPERQRHRAAA